MSYQKLNLQNGDIWDASHVSRLEDGIKENETAISNVALECVQHLANLNVKNGSTTGSVNATKNNAIFNSANPYIQKTNQTAGAKNIYSVALGGISLASGQYALTEGYYTIASGKASHAEGYSTLSQGTYSHAEGEGSVAVGTASHVEGYQTVDKGYLITADLLKDEILTTSTMVVQSATQIAFATDDEILFPDNMTFLAKIQDSLYYGSVKIGNPHLFTLHSPVPREILQKATSMTLYTYNSVPTPIKGCHAEGQGTYAVATGQHVEGRYNQPSADYIHITGNGHTDDGIVRSNAFTVSYDGNVSALGELQSATGADYAEYFEWEDGNPDNEDRVGYIVTLNQDKICLAHSFDEDILGIVSGTAAVVGDTAIWDWAQKYEVDNFGRIVWDMVEEFVEVEDEEGNLVPQSIGVFPRRRLNANYDDSQTYIPRSKRQEWDAIGLVGKLHVRDDGSCIPGGYATVGDTPGVATYSSEKTNMRVMKRINDNIILVFMK